MKLIKDIEVRYNIRVKKILEMDMQMGLYTGWNSDVSEFLLKKKLFGIRISQKDGMLLILILMR